VSEVVGEAVLRFGVDRTAADDGLADIEKDAEKRGKSSGGKFSGAFKTALKVGAAGITAGLLVGTALFQVGSQFDDLSDTIQVSTGASGRALQGLTDDADAVARRVPVAISAIGPVLSTLTQKLGLTGKPLQDLTEQFLDLQHITGEAVDTDAITGALNLFNVKAGDVGGVMDELFRVTQQTGVGFNDLSGILARQGPALQQFGFGIKDSASLIGSLSKAGIDPSRTLGTLTRALSTFAKAGKDPQQALGKTVDGIQALIDKGDQAGAIDLAGKVFGTRGATQFVTAVQAGRLNLEDLSKVTEGNTNTIIGSTRATEDFSERLQLLKNRVLLALEPVANRVFSAVGDGIQAVNTSGALPAIADGVRTVAHDLEPLLSKGVRLGRQVLPQVVSVIEKLAPKVLHLGEALGGDLVTAAGHVVDILAPLVEDAVGLGQSFIDNGGLDKAIGLLTGLGDILTKVTGFLADHDTAVRAVLITVGTAIALWKVWSLGVAAVSAVTKAFTAVQAALNFVLDANPIGLVVIALVALAAGLIYAYKHSDRFRAIVDSIGRTVASVFGGIVDFFKNHWGLIVSLIGGPIGIVAVQVIKHFDDIKAGVHKVIDFVTAIPGKIADLAGSMKDAGKDFVTGLFHGITSAAGKAGGVVADIASDVFDAITGLINDAIDLLNNGIPDSIGKGPVSIDLPNNPIPHLARGTDRWPGGWSWVGEEGPELVNVPRGAQVLPAAQSAAAAGGPAVQVLIQSVQPHNYRDFERTLMDKARIATLGSRRPLAMGVGG
jgi:TP901 family phage tail tape measure protein